MHFSFFLLILEIFCSVYAFALVSFKVSVPSSPVTPARNIDILHQFPSLKIDDLSGIVEQVISLGPMQSTKLSLPQFITSTLAPMSQTARRKIAYFRDSWFRKNKRTYALIEPAAIDGRLDNLIRLLEVHSLSMASVRESNSPTMKTSIDAKIFAKVWAPKRFQSWDLLWSFQKDELNGVIIYRNKLCNTLAIIFRPFVDNDDILLMQKQAMEDPETHAYPQAFTVYRESESIESTPLQLSGHTIKVSPLMNVRYAKMERAVMEWIDINVNTKMNLVTAGISGGGHFAVMFALRCAMMPFPGLEHFGLKQVYGFNIPPLFSADSPLSEMSELLERKGWVYSRVVSDDHGSVYWFGNTKGIAFKHLYEHLGDAIHVTEDTKRFGEDKQQNVVLMYKNTVRNFPSQLFKHTIANSEERLEGMSVVYQLWLRLRYHVMGLGLTLTFMKDALLRRLKWTQTEWINWMWVSSTSSSPE